MFNFFETRSSLSCSNLGACRLRVIACRGEFSLYSAGRDESLYIFWGVVQVKGKFLQSLLFDGHPYPLYPKEPPGSDMYWGISHCNPPPVTPVASSLKG